MPDLARVRKSFNALFGLRLPVSSLATDECSIGKNIVDAWLNARQLLMLRVPTDQ